MKPEPLIVTVVPPAPGPVPGLTAVTVGTPVYVKSSEVEVAEVPTVVVTVTATVPVPAGVEAAIEVELATVTPVAGTEPKSTIAPLMKPVPLMVTLVPPAAGPVPGLTAVTVGTLVYVKSVEVTEVPAVVVTVTATVPVPAGVEA